MGAEIEGEGTGTITVQGVDRLNGATHPVVADRIETGTYMLGPAIAGGELELVGGRIDLLEEHAALSADSGVTIRTGGGARIEVKRHFDASVLRGVVAALEAQE